MDFATSFVFLDAVLAVPGLLELEVARERFQCSDVMHYCHVI